MAYGVTACRILLTKNDYANHPHLIPYDPTEGNGPWWFDEASGTHYWNGEHCLEFMIEHDIEFSALTDIDFVEHHKKQCNIDPKTCPERGVPRGLAAARFLSRLAAHGVGLPETILSDPQKLSSFKMSRAHALFYMKERISALAKEFNGPFAADNPNSISICRGILNAYAVSTLHTELPALAALFCSQEDLMACCASLIASATGVALEPPDALRQTRRRPF